MIKKVTLALSIFSAFLFTELPAQNVYFTGLGRALVTNDGLKDNTDTASKMKASGGYTLFDLGVYAKPNEVLRGGVILRLRNEFGGFFSDGASLEFRQMQLEGLIAKKVKYEIGDIYLTHTPYTLWNEKNIYNYNKYEAGIFSLRRDIVYYENFFVGNAWRMQGFNAKSKINFSKGVDSLGIRAYGGRTMQTNFTTTPDRYFYGGRLDLAQSKYFRIAGNLAGISDIAGTVEDAEVDYDNMVYTTDFSVTLDQEKFKLALNGEAGASHFELDRAIDTTHHEFNDFFYDAGVEATYKPFNLTLGASYRDVGFNFNSPMAQTRRIASPGDISVMTFPVMNDGTTGRPISLFDPYTQESRLYNQAISTTLMNYFVQYDMVEPYGKATPNRRGFTFSANIEEKDKLFNAGIEANLLSEGVSEGDSLTKEKRKFTLIRGGLVFNVNKLMEFEKLIAINAGLRMESSTRGGTNPVDLSSSLIDVGLDLEVLKDLHLLGGAKLFSVKGTEIQTGRDELNQIVSFGHLFWYKPTPRRLVPIFY
ncbi:MAG: hypothetical protein K2X86_17555, partial [Cytophagaceae bacterium]|nr:hypothetical protein [Cytophagaceae bacterium]